MLFHALTQIGEDLPLYPTRLAVNFLRYHPHKTPGIGDRRSLSVIVEEQNSVEIPCISLQQQNKPWHVLHVRSNFERRVAQHLSVRAVEHYVPFYRERVRWTDRTVVTERPLFSGYVFTRYAPESRITVISVPGVVRLLGEEEGNTVSSGDLDKIRKGLASGHLLRPHSSVSVGARVRIRVGLFEGVEGVVTELRQQCKVIMSLAAVRQCFSLEVELRDVEVLKQPVVSLSSSPSCFSWNMQPANS
jgi:transcription antitermination factor NusG